MSTAIIYCYDAWCGWCYGFSPVIKRLWEEYGDRYPFEVLSGGMILPEEPRHISVIAGYIKKAYRVVEENTGIVFGSDFLWHINNPELSDWFPSSEKPSIALCVFKEYQAERQVEFAADLQYALHIEGRDLTDDEAYRHLLRKYRINEEEFYDRLRSGAYKEKAYEEFAQVKRLQVTGFPALLLQVSETKFYLLARGYTGYEALKSRLDQVLEEIKNPA